MKNLILATTANKPCSGSFTFFKQRFYKTNYLFGFGTTEDVPYGYSVALTAGWYKQLDLRRLYSGIDVNKYVVNHQGDVAQFFLRAGSFFSKNEWQDGSILTGISGFSRPLIWGNVKVRQYVNLSYTRMFNRTALSPLTLTNDFGIRYFTADTTYGQQRISIHSETSMFFKL